MGFGCLDLTVPGRRLGHQGGEEGGRSPSDFIDGSIEGFSVCGRWFGKSTDLPYELQGCHPDLFIGRRGFEIIQGLDIPAHSSVPFIFTLRIHPDSSKFHAYGRDEIDHEAPSSCVVY